MAKVSYELVVVRKRFDRAFRSNYTLTVLSIISVDGLFAWKNAIQSCRYLQLSVTFFVKIIVCIILESSWDLMFLRNDLSFLFQTIVYFIKKCSNNHSFTPVPDMCFRLLFFRFTIVDWLIDCHETENRSTPQPSTSHLHVCVILYTYLVYG